MTTNEDRGETEARLRAILAGIVDRAFMATDPEGRVTEWSPGAQDLFGWTADEILGRSGEVICPPGDPAKHAIAPEHGPDPEGWYRRKDGTRFRARSDLKALAGRDGKPLGTIRLWRVDPIDRNETDAAAQERDAELRLVADALPVLVAYVDKDLVYRFANRTYEDWFRIAPSQLVGRTVLDLVGPEGFELRRPYMDRVLAGETVLFEAEWPYGDGRSRSVDIRYLPRRTPAGEIDGFYAFVIDITERKRAEQVLSEAYDALATSEDLLRRAQAAGHIGTFDVDLNRNELKGSDEFWRVFGLAPLRVADPAMIERMVVAEDRGDSSTAESRRAGREARAVEYRIVRADTGEVRWLGRAADYTLGDDGRPVRLIGTIQDITERKQAVEDLRRNEELLRAFMDAMPNQVWTGPADGRLDWFNEQVYRYSGFSKGDLDGIGWTRMVHPDDLGLAADRWARALEDHARYETEFRLLKSDGTYRWHIARAQPIHGPDGTLNRWIGTNTDIHEQTTLAAELRRLNQTLEQRVEERTRERDRIWQVSRDLIVIVGRDGFYKSANPAWATEFGYPESTMIGAHFNAFVHADDRAAVQAGYETLLAGSQLGAFEVRTRANDGSYRWISWVVVALDDDYYASGRDVTVQRQIEEQLRQSQKMEAVGQLTGGIAHDFNNLLTGIGGALDLIQKRLEQGRTADVSRYIGMAATSATRAAALTHRLLAFSRRQPLDPKTTDANRLVASMEELLRRTLGESIGLEIVFTENLWLTLCDPNQLENALLNLVINARDAMPKGGRLTIETANTHLDRAYAKDHDITPGPFVCVAVTDNGAGMPPDVATRAFDPFFTTKPLGHGTGLGLSMIYGFMRQSDGHIRIYSEVGTGTTIKMYLPRFRGEPEPEPDGGTAAALRRAEAGETVLVVEDEPSVRELVVEVLGELGYRALQASDGPAGLRLLQSSERVDLLITDVGLPGMNGRQLAERGRSDRPDLKVLFITGYAENAIFGHGHLDPHMQMMTKPFAVDALASRIREMIEGL